MLVLASLSLVEADGADWLIKTELNKIGYGKRVQIFKYAILLASILIVSFAFNVRGAAGWGFVVRSS